MAAHHTLNKNSKSFRWLPRPYVTQSDHTPLFFLKQSAHANPRTLYTCVSLCLDHSLPRGLCGSLDISFGSAIKSALLKWLCLTTWSEIAFPPLPSYPEYTTAWHEVIHRLICFLSLDCKLLEDVIFILFITVFTAPKTVPSKYIFVAQ